MEEADIKMMLSQIEDYGKWNGTLISTRNGYRNCIPVSVAKQIVRARGLGGCLGYLDENNCEVSDG